MFRYSCSVFKITFKSYFDNVCLIYSLSNSSVFTSWKKLSKKVTMIVTAFLVYAFLTPGVFLTSVKRLCLLGVRSSLILTLFRASNSFLLFLSASALSTGLSDCCSRSISCSNSFHFVIAENLASIKRSRTHSSAKRTMRGLNCSLLRPFSSRISMISLWFDFYTVHFRELRYCGLGWFFFFHSKVGYTQVWVALAALHLVSFKKWFN